MTSLPEFALIRIHDRAFKSSVNRVRRRFVLFPPQNTNRVVTGALIDIQSVSSDGCIKIQLASDLIRYLRNHLIESFLRSHSPLRPFRFINAVLRQTDIDTKLDRVAVENLRVVERMQWDQVRALLKVSQILLANFQIAMRFLVKPAFGNPSDEAEAIAAYPDAPLLHPFTKVRNNIIRPEMLLDLVLQPFNLLIGKGVHIVHRAGHGLFAGIGIGDLPLIIIQLVLIPSAAAGFPVHMLFNALTEGIIAKDLFQFILIDGRIIVRINEMLDLMSVFARDTAEQKNTEALKIKTDVQVAYYYKQLSYIQTEMNNIQKRIAQYESSTLSTMNLQSTRYTSMNSYWNMYSATKKIWQNKSALNSYLTYCGSYADNVISYANTAVNNYNSAKTRSEDIIKMKSDAKIAYDYIRNNASSASTEYRNNSSTYNDINTLANRISNSMSRLTSYKNDASSRNSTAKTMKTKVTDAKKSVSKL